MNWVARIRYRDSERRSPGSRGRASDRPSAGVERKSGRQSAGRDTKSVWSRTASCCDRCAIRRSDGSRRQARRRNRQRRNRAGNFNRKRSRSRLNWVARIRHCDCERRSPGSRGRASDCAGARVEREPGRQCAGRDTKSIGSQTAGRGDCRAIGGSNRSGR